MNRRSKGIHDPGFGNKFEKIAERSIKKDGSFNIKRINFGYNFKNTYQALIRMNWVMFFTCVTIFIVGSNFIFASIYFTAGIDQLSGLENNKDTHHFFQCLYFSFQTFTTVGYGTISPIGHLTGIVSSIEAVFGLVSFAFITGLLYGRFSRPNALFQYSKNILIAPYEDGWSLQFRFVNSRSSQIIELKADVMISISKMNKGKVDRQFYRLPLEADNILFLPLNWNIVHPIDKDSPFFGMTQREVLDSNVEIMILIKGYDDTFSQIVHSRFSYIANEIIWGAKFVRPYFVNEDGSTTLDSSLIDQYESVPYINN